MEESTNKINISDAVTFLSLTQTDLKTICKALASKLYGISLNHTWTSCQYRESDEEIRDHQIVNDAVEMLEYFSKIL